MAKRHPGSRRTRKQTSEDGEDAFVASILDFSNWAQQNQQVLTITGVVLAILLAGGVYYVNFQSQLEDQAADQLEVIYGSIQMNDVEGAKVDLATFLDRFSGTALESEARLVLGELYLESGDSQQALAVLGEIGQSPRSPIEFQGAALLAAAYEQEERWAEAEETYLTIAQRSDLDFQVRGALAAAARIRSQHRDDPQGAIELYQQVLDDMEETAPERGRYEMRIQELQSAGNNA